jgi:hypothetical protein
MSKDMADKQHNAGSLRPVVNAEDSPRENSKATGRERWVQDALEDDEVREILKRLHASQSSGSA